MTAQELADKLNGREYTEEITEAEEKAAKKEGLLVVFGSSDDLIEYRGAIKDESCAYEGGDFFIDPVARKVLEPTDDTEREVLEKYGAVEFVERRYKGAIKIVAHWAWEGYSWFLETKHPHATFDIMEDGEKYCRGLVIALKL